MQNTCVELVSSLRVRYSQNSWTNKLPSRSNFTIPEMDLIFRVYILFSYLTSPLSACYRILALDFHFRTRLPALACKFQRNSWETSYTSVSSSTRWLYGIKAETGVKMRQHPKIVINFRAQICVTNFMTAAKVFFEFRSRLVTQFHIHCELSFPSHVIP